MIVATTLSRDDIITGLRHLVDELQRNDKVAGIRLVGGAALALRYFDRGTTQDLDALHVHPGNDDDVTSAAQIVADRMGWEPTWLNFNVAQIDALPTVGREVEWETIFNQGGIVIEVASRETLLVMKMRASRPGRDTRDIRLLLSLCGISTVGEAEELYEQFYPGDSLTDRAIAMVNAILADGPAAPPESPPTAVI